MAYIWIESIKYYGSITASKMEEKSHGLGRYRSPQLKKMTVDMMEPFIWPEVPQAKLDLLKTQRDNSLKTVQQNAVGADKLKPLMFMMECI